jgi:predicted O-methyltransferase YrrM
VAIPALVVRARAAAAELGLERSWRDEDGRLLHVLAGRRGIERVAELGTGAGVGTAWLSSALPPGVPLFGAELDPRLADAAAALFADDPDVHVLTGDWRVVLPPQAPFDLVVAGGGAKDDPDAVLGLAAPGATIVLDVTAGPSGTDVSCERWHRHPRLVAVELGTGGDTRTLVGIVRR